MITWMQKHHKYLVVTIWISVIAFVGAGFVGWGSYSYGTTSNNSVVQVEDTTISVDEFQREYSNEVSRIRKDYPSVSDSDIKNSKIDLSILNRLTNKAILLQYAKDKGLISTKQEVKEILKKTKSFQKDGIFNKDVYYDYLKAVRVIAKDYEKSLESNIVLQKLLATLNLPILEFEKEALRATLSLQDRLEIKIIDKEEIKVEVSEEELKKYWEANKNKYKSKKSFVIETYELPITHTTSKPEKLKEYWSSHKLSFKKENGKLKSFEEAIKDVQAVLNNKDTKNKALLKRLELQKSKASFQKQSVILENDLIFPVGSFTSKKINTIFKPIKVVDKFVIFRLVAINNPKVLSFENAKAVVKTEATNKKQDTALQNKAKKELENLQGKDTGFVSRESKIDGLQAQESVEFLNFVFNSSSKQGYKVLGSKAIVFKVLEQKLLEDKNNNTLNQIVEQSVSSIKNSLVLQGLVSSLRKKYKIVNFYQGR